MVIFLLNLQYLFKKLYLLFCCVKFSFHICDLSNHLQRNQPQIFVPWNKVSNIMLCKELGVNVYLLYL